MPVQKLCCFFLRKSVLITQCQQTNKAINPVVFSLGRAPVVCACSYINQSFLASFIALSSIKMPTTFQPGALHCFWGCNHARNTTAKRKASFLYTRNNIFHRSPACTGQCDHRLLPQPPVVSIMMKAFENALYTELPGGDGRAQCGVLQSEHPSKGRVPHGVPALRMLHICASNYCKGVQLSLSSTQLKLKHCQEQSVFGAVLRSRACLRMWELSLFSLPLLSARVLEVSKRPFSSLARSENCLPQFGTSFSQKLSLLGVCLQPGMSQSIYLYMSIQ